MEKITVKLARLEKCPVEQHALRRSRMEFHINGETRREYGVEDSLFSLSGNVIFADIRQARLLAAKFNAKPPAAASAGAGYIKAGDLFAMGLIDEILHYVVSLYRKQVQSNVFETALAQLGDSFGWGKTGELLETFSAQFPPAPVYKGEKDVGEYLQGSDGGDSCRSISLEETMFLSLANLNPAFSPFKFMFDDKDMAVKTVYPQAIEQLKEHFKKLPAFGETGMSLWDILRAPALASPHSLAGQLAFMQKNWGLDLSKYLSRILVGIDVIKEENKPVFGGPGPSEVMTFAGLDEYERFSQDLDWMPKTVLMAKSTLVWLFQLSEKYAREIKRIDEIPDEELDLLAARGFTGLWLIGLWERSAASRTIKQWTGNPEAAASAYSLYDYDIAGDLGGWGALNNLRERCLKRGIRLGSDMVPNHTGLDSRWLIEHPDRFLQLPYPPFPSYTYNCDNLSGRGDVTVQIEDHYFERSDAAVVFKRIDNNTGHTRYIYHGNDGTSMPWNDTAQIDFLNPEAREAVIQTILGVCRQFSIVRFDAAMTLAKRHIQRLWYPPPGSGGAIASRAEHSITTDEFNARIPNEFWREVVDRCAHEAPHTLLLAEAFWMMEGYFVRTLGMHRVYNSAFMNMLKNEENDKYRATIKNTLSFDPEVLKRFVNFMNNPDEDTAVEQFGKGDKYFGICTLLVTMPGLPMFGHGQIEGFEEKYGMEYSRSYKNESEDAHLVWRHEREIFPLMKRRALFSGSEKFRIFDLYIDSDNVNENVFAYTNRVFTGAGEEKALVFFNNSYHQTAGWIKHSDPEIPEKDGGVKRDSLSEALAIHGDANYFTLLREQKSGLWFVRSSKGICENGFFVSLNGYETQVYIDIYEREDDSRGHWARLHNDLGGRGTPDPQAAIMDIFLGELYYRFAELFKPENIATLHGYFTGETPKTEEHFEAFIASLAAPLEAYMDEAEKFIKGGEGSFDAWKATDEDGREIVFTPMGKNPKGALNIMRRDFENALREFVKIAEDVPAKAAPEKTVKRIKNLTLAEVLAGEIKEKPFLCAAYLGYALFALLRGVIGWETEYRITATGRQAANLAFEHWGFGRKLAEQCKNFGASEDDARRAADFAHFVLSRTGGWRGTHIAAIDRELREMDKAFGGNFSKSIANLEKINRGGWWAAKVIENNYADEDLRRVLGVNVFEDITWFNKESFENLLFFGSLYLVAESAEVLPPLLSGSWWTKGMPEVDRSKDKRRVDTLDKTYQALVFAGEKSGWRLNALIDILAGDLSVADSQPDTPPGGK